MDGCSVPIPQLEAFFSLSAKEVVTEMPHQIMMFLDISLCKVDREHP